MAKVKETKKRKKKKKKIKKKFRKLFVSTAAFITAAVVVIFCLYYVYFKTDYFNVTEIHVSGNKLYNMDYIKTKSQIEDGEKIFNVDRNKVKNIIEDEIYVENARVAYELPNKVFIELTERQEKYQIFYNNEYIVTDEEGFVLRIGTEKNELITIESLADVLYNVGEIIEIAGIENVQSIFQAVDYIDGEFGAETVKNLYIDSNNSFLIETEYGTFIRIELDEDIKYQVVFAMKIINERLNNNLVVANGLIDFTKGDSPVYSEDFKREEYNE
jgi:hypothetical protein